MLSGARPRPSQSLETTTLSLTHIPLRGAQSANDPDNPIAASHKGPISYYLAKVGNAATTGTTGLKWFKVAHEGLSGGKWAVDNMIAAGGWHYFTMPSCVAPGDYLLRVELIALHSAGTQGGAQFYMECAQIRVTGSGTNTGSNFVSMPSPYSPTDPGVLVRFCPFSLSFSSMTVLLVLNFHCQVNIYDNSGQPYMGGKSYSIPGPAPIQCSGNSGEGGSIGSGSGSGSGSDSGSGSGAGAALWAQCGGTGYTGPTTCAQGTCKATNEYYSQCVA